MNDAKKNFAAWANQYRQWLCTERTGEGERSFRAFVYSVKPTLIAVAKEAGAQGIDVTKLWDTIGKLEAIPLGKIERHLDLAWAIAQQLPDNKPPKRSRAKPDSEVTKWVRKNWHKYGYNKTQAVNGYIDIKELSVKLFDSLYTQLNNDCRKKPLVKPKKAR